MPNIITLTTDFGYKDPFTGEMKGAILSINPSAIIVDLTHGIEPFDVLEAAFVVGSAYKYFPPGTVHVVVVDPGVGSERRPIILEAGGHSFVGPDNGVFSLVASETLRKRCFHITQEQYMLSRESPTFQGRDVFAPVAAWLSRGVNPLDIGPEIRDYAFTKVPVPLVTKEGLCGKVLYIDQFGNAITNITGKDLLSFGKEYAVEIKGRHVVAVHHYAEAAPGQLHCLVNSSGYLELFIFCNSAARLFGIKKGDAVSVLEVTH